MQKNKSDMYRVVRTYMRLCLGAGLLLVAGSTWADVKLHALFNDNMVLQRDSKLKVWGTAAAGEKVSISICGQTALATADDKGKWKVTLNPLAAGGPFEMIVVGNDNKTNVLKNVLVGDVWVCSGQSNMAMSMGGVKNAQEERTAANYPMIRHFHVQGNVQNSPQENVDGSWQVCSPHWVNEFTAVGYFFGRDLNKALNIPIGLLHTSWGGSYAESWTPCESLQADPDLLPLLEKSQGQLLEFARAINKTSEVINLWLAEAKKAKAENKPIPPMPPPQPALGPNPMENWAFSTSRYNGMIAPLTQYAIRGVIWYQGESNVRRAWQYRKLLPAMIAAWRKAWGQGDFPFYIVQLANYSDAQPEPCESDWAELREAQTMTAKNVPNCGQAVIIDIGDAKDIHPKNKQDVGGRLALVARAKTYGEKIVYSGPQYESMSVAGNKMILKFQHVGGGLVAKGGEPLKQFAIAGEDKKFVWADAKIVGDTVVVSNVKLTAPVAVRYAWQNNPEGCNLYNKEGLPASPFRTDDWPMTTLNKNNIW